MKHHKGPQEAEGVEVDFTSAYAGPVLGEGLWNIFGFSVLMLQTGISSNSCSDSMFTSQPP